MNEQKLIEQIHYEFDSAQDRLLQEAKKVLSNTNDSVVNIAERLKAIGFVNTPTAKKGLEVKDQLVKSKQEAELIEYYATNYPFLKFLTESELDRICTKYNLVYASISRYVKEVPERNLTDIETAQRLKESDKFLITFKHYFKFYSYVPKEVMEHLQGFESLESHNRGDDFFRDICPIKYSGPYLYEPGGLTIEQINKNGLFIAAPGSHFDTQGLIKKGLGFFEVFKTEIKDPIVFRYVRGGVQVITKWGLEANDPSLVVPKLN